VNGRERSLPKGADVVVIGAGMAGLAVAAELDAAGAPDVVVLETGDDQGFDHYRYQHEPDIAQEYWLRPEIDPAFSRPYERTDQSFGGLAGLRQRTGGRSLYWHGVTLPMDTWALRSPEWPQTIADDLLDGWAGGASLFNRVTSEIRAWSGRDTLAGPATVELGGCSLRETPQAVRTESSGRSRVYSPLEYWRTQGTRPPVINGCRSLGLIARNGGIEGVRVSRRGEIVDVAATIVVLCAGTVENSRLAIQLLHEGGQLAPPSLSGLADKVVQGFVTVLPSGSSPECLASAASVERLFVASAENLRSNLFVRTFRTDHGDSGVDAWLMGEQRPGRSGYVQCRPASAWPWKVSVACALSDVDRELAAAQRHELDEFRARLVEDTGVALTPLRFDRQFGSRDLPARLTWARGATPSPKTLTYAFPLGSEQHESGTLPLGSIVDDNHAVRGAVGLYVGGASQFPRAGAANPTLTILALAKRLAHQLATGRRR
jgi:hypothetical protein